MQPVPTACPVIHWEIGTADPETHRRFYRSVFGWDMFVVQPSAYTMIACASPGGLGGGIADTRGGFPDYLTLYIEVDDVAAWMKRTLECGGQPMMGPFAATETLTVGFISDPDGTMIGLMFFSGPLELPPNFLNGELDYPAARFEIGSRDLQRSGRFYRDLFGWEIQTEPQPGNGIIVAFPDPRRAPGDIVPVQSTAPSHARPIILTDHPAELLERIREHGGSIVRPPATDPGIGGPALFSDPGGHILGIAGK